MIVILLNMIREWDFQLPSRGEVLVGKRIGQKITFGTELAQLGQFHASQMLGCSILEN